MIPSVEPLKVEMSSKCLRKFYEDISDVKQILLCTSRLVIVDSFSLFHSFTNTTQQWWITFSYMAPFHVPRLQSKLQSHIHTLMAAS